MWPFVGIKSFTHPRVSDTIFVPKQYYKYLNHVFIEDGHKMWDTMIPDLTYHDLDTMIPTRHNSNSEKESNPLYRKSTARVNVSVKEKV